MLIFAATTASSPPRVLMVPSDLAKEFAPVCKRAVPELVERTPKKPVRSQKLNELPNADEYLTVMRFDEKGCQKPAIVAYDIGSAPKRQR
jgi:hypothetical protein